MKGWIRIVIPLTLLLSMSLACQLGAFGGSATEPPPAEQPAEPTDAAVPAGDAGETQATTVPEAQPGESGEEPLSLSSITQGLDSLQSYTSHATVAYANAGSSEPTSGVIEMDTEYVREPLAQRILFRGPEMEGTLEFVRIGDEQYMNLGGGQCMSTSAGEENGFGPEILDANELFGGLSDAQRVLPDETVNGVLCRHYRFDQTALIGVQGMTQAAGEVWVAADGGYVVRYTMHAEGKEPTTGLEGQFDFSYELAEINPALDIQAPQGCGAVNSEFPMMPDATDVSSLGGMLMYNSASALEDVLSFYQAEMGALGWNLAENPYIIEDTAMLSFTRDEETVTVTLSVEEGSVSVVIMKE